MPARAASGAESTAQSTRHSPARAAPSAAAIVPATGRTRPSSPSSPMQACSSSRPGGTCAEAARTASAIARSKPVPSLRRAAGARFTVIASPWPLEKRRVDPAPHSMLRLLAGAVGEPHDRERGQVARARCASTSTRRGSSPTSANVTARPSTPRPYGASGVRSVPCSRRQRDFEPSVEKAAVAAGGRPCRPGGQPTDPRWRRARGGGSGEPWVPPRLVSRRSRGRTA